MHPILQAGKLLKTRNCPFLSARRSGLGSGQQVQCPIVAPNYAPDCDPEFREVVTGFYGYSIKWYLSYGTNARGILACGFVGQNKACSCEGSNEFDEHPRCQLPGVSHPSHRFP